MLWQPESRLVTPIPTNEQQDLRSVAFSGELTRLVFGYGSGDLYVWDLPAEAPSGGPMRLAGHIPETLGLSPDGALAASGDGRGNFVLWDLGERRAVGDPLRSPESSLDALFWEGRLRTGTGPQSMARTFEKVLFNPDGSRLTTTSFDNRAVLWDTRARRRVGEPLVGNTGPIASLAFSPDGAKLASGDLAGLVVIFDVATGKQDGPPLQGPLQNVESLAFSPDGAILASGTKDGSVILWDVTTRRRVGEPLRGHASSVVNIAFSPDAATLASAGDDGTIGLWDRATGQLLGELFDWHSTAVSSLIFGDDGATLATGSQDGTAYLDVDPSSWRASACAIANRNLTDAEWTRQLGPNWPHRPTCP